MRRVVAGLVAAMCLGIAPVVAAPPQPRLTIADVSAPGTVIERTLLPVIVTFNQTVEQRKVRVQRFATGRWIGTEELRVTGPQVSVPVRLPQAGVHRLRLLVLDPAGRRWVVSRTFTVRVTRAAFAMIRVEPCDGTLTAAHDGRRLWTLCARPGSGSINDGGRRNHDIGPVSAFVLQGTRVWMLRDADVLPLDTTADELLRPIPVVGVPDEHAGVIAAGPSGVWVLSVTIPPSFGLGDPIPTTLSRIDPVTLTVTDRIALPPSSVLSPSGIHVGTRNVWITRTPIHPADGKGVIDYLRVNPVRRRSRD